MPPSPSVNSLLDQASRRLAASGSESPRLDARLLLSEATGWSREALLAHPEWTPSDDQAARFERLIQRRETSEPTAYVLGWREFYGRRFKVDQRVLIPRPETEALVERAVTAVQRWRERGVEIPRVVDVGTGSGAIAVSVALEANVAVTATDVSGEALEVAIANAESLGAGDRVRFVAADLLAGLDGPWHVVVANLPYVPAERTLARDVARFEPHLALFGGAEGTDLAERLLREARPRLTRGADLLLEIDHGQGERLTALARALYPSAALSVQPDHAGLERILVVKLT